MGKVFVNIGLSLDGYMAPDGCAEIHQAVMLYGLLEQTPVNHGKHFYQKSRRSLRKWNRSVSVNTSG